MQFEDTLAFCEPLHGLFKRLTVRSHGNWKPIVEGK